MSSTPLFPDFLIVEMGERLSSAACCSLLAELGATVVVVEPAGERHPSGKAPNRATMAAGKLSVTLDPSDASSVDLVCDLIKKADAVVTSSDLDGGWPAAVKAALKDNPNICDITAFADAAPTLAMSEGLMQALTGTMDTTGDPESAPTLTRAPVLEIATGIYAAAGLLLARVAQRRYGIAQPVRIALFDCAVSMMTTFLPRHLMGAEPKRIGNHHPSMSPWNAYRANDGWVMVCSGSNEQWKRICTLIGRPELAADSRFENATARVRANADVDELMQTWASDYSVDECMKRLNDVVIPCGPVCEVSQLFEDVSLRYRDMINELRDPESGRDLRTPGTLFRSSRTQGVAAARIPAKGGDRAAVAQILKNRSAKKLPAKAKPKAVLDGIKVLEIGQYTTAPLTARQLGAFGADVVKIEPPGGEPARTLPPHRDGQSLFFTLSNSDKRGTVIDLRNEQHKKLFAEMVKRADVLVENMKPGALARFGFTPDELARLNPRLVYCAVSGFGADSPNSALGAMDTTIQGMSGIMDLTRSNGTPFKIGLSIADIIGGQLGLLFILAALEHRERTGIGQFIDLSMQDAAAWIIRTEWNGSDVALPATLPCTDGFVVCETGGDEIKTATDTMTREAAVRELTAKGYAAAPVLRLTEALKSRHVTDRDLIVMGKSPSGAEWHLFNSPIRLAETPANVSRAMGPLGCDTDDILSDWNIELRPVSA